MRVVPAAWRGRFLAGELSMLGTRMMGAACVEIVRPTASYRAIELGAGGLAIGAVAGAFAMLAMLVAIRIGRAVDRHGEKGLLIGGVALLGVAATIGSSLPWLAAVIVMQALLGLGQACMSVSCQTIASNLTGTISDHRFARLSVAVAMGHMLGPLLAGIAIQGSSLLPTVLEGTTGALALAVLVAGGAVVVASRTRSTPPDRRQSAAVGDRPVPVLELLRLGGMPSAIYAGIAVLTTVDLLVAYLPVLGEVRGIAPGVIGALLATRASMSIVSRLLMGRMLDRLGRRRLLVWALTVSAVAVAAIAVPVPTWVMFMQLSVVGFLLGIGIPMTTAWVAARAPAGSRGVALGLRTSGNRVSQMAVPVAVGGVAAGLGPAAVFVTSSVVLAFGGHLVRRAPIHE